MSINEIFTEGAKWCLALPYAEQAKIYNACIKEKARYPWLNICTIFCAAYTIEKENRRNDKKKS